MASWRTNLGLVGLSMAHTRKMVIRTIMMKAITAVKIRRTAASLPPPWLPQSLDIFTTGLPLSLSLFVIYFFPLWVVVTSNDGRKMVVRIILQLYVMAYVLCALCLEFRLYYRI